MINRFVRSLAFFLYVAAALFQLSPLRAETPTLTIGGTGAALGAMTVLADAFSAGRPGVSVRVAKSLGSGGGIRAVMAGALDIGLSARPLTPEETAAGVKQIAYARSAFVLVTNRARSGTTMTAARIAEIFSGGEAVWNDGARIRVILRPEQERDSGLLATFFPGVQLDRARERSGAPIALSDQEAMDKAEAVPGSLTTATLTAVVAERRSLATVAIDGVAPTLENLASGTYPYSKTLYLITGPAAGEHVRDFIRFVRSEAGAALLRQTGNIPL